MSSPLRLDGSDGFVVVEVANDDGTTAAARLDLFEANNTYAALCDQHADPIARANAWVEWLLLKGLPPVSHGSAYRLADRIVEQVAEFKKKDTSSPSAG